MKSTKQLLKDAKEGKLTQEDIMRIKDSINFWKEIRGIEKELFGEMMQAGIEMKWDKTTIGLIIGIIVTAPLLLPSFLFCMALLMHRYLMEEDNHSGHRKTGGSPF